MNDKNLTRQQYTISLNQKSKPSTLHQFRWWGYYNFIIKDKELLRSIYWGDNPDMVLNPDYPVARYWLVKTLEVKSETLDTINGEVLVRDTMKDFEESPIINMTYATEKFRNLISSINGLRCSSVDRSIVMVYLLSLIWNPTLLLRLRKGEDEVLEINPETKNIANWFETLVRLGKHKPRTREHHDQLRKLVDNFANFNKPPIILKDRQEETTMNNSTPLEVILNYTRPNMAGPVNRENYLNYLIDNEELVRALINGESPDWRVNPKLKKVKIWLDKLLGLSKEPPPHENREKYKELRMTLNEFQDHPIIAIPKPLNNTPFIPGGNTEMNTEQTETQQHAALGRLEDVLKYAGKSTDGVAFGEYSNYVNSLLANPEFVHGVIYGTNPNWGVERTWENDSREWLNYILKNVNTQHDVSLAVQKLQKLHSFPITYATPEPERSSDPLIAFSRCHPGALRGSELLRYASYLWTNPTLVDQLLGLELPEFHIVSKEANEWLFNLTGADKDPTMANEILRELSEMKTMPIHYIVPAEKSKTFNLERFSDKGSIGLEFDEVYDYLSELIRNPDICKQVCEDDAGSDWEFVEGWGADIDRRWLMKLRELDLSSSDTDVSIHIEYLVRKKVFPLHYKCGDVPAETKSAEEYRSRGGVNTELKGLGLPKRSVDDVVAELLTLLGGEGTVHGYQLEVMTDVGVWSKSMVKHSK